MMQTHSSIFEIYLLLPLQQSTIIEESITRLRVFSFFSIHYQIFQFPLLIKTFFIYHLSDAIIFIYQMQTWLGNNFLHSTDCVYGIKKQKAVSSSYRFTSCTRSSKKGVKCGCKSLCKSIMCSCRRNELSCSISFENY